MFVIGNQVTLNKIMIPIANQNAGINVRQCIHTAGIRADEISGDKVIVISEAFQTDPIALITAYQVSFSRTGTADESVLYALIEDNPLTMIAQGFGSGDVCPNVVADDNDVCPQA
jgi:hypothetical protein